MSGRRNQLDAWIGIGRLPHAASVGLLIWAVSGVAVRMIGTVCSLLAGAPAVRSKHVFAAERWAGRKSQHQRSYDR